VSKAVALASLREGMDHSGEPLAGRARLRQEVADALGVYAEIIDWRSLDSAGLD
jgi:hypothetical protein